jgi:ribose transport system ATP-binding protein
MDIHRGEIVGIAGVVGSGRESILGALFGAIERQGGSVTADGKVIRPGRPDVAVQHGLAYLPAERKDQGLIAGLNARENLTLCDLGPFWNKATLSRAREVSETQRWFGKLSVRPAGATEMLLENFSGGNQQKVLLARLLRCQPKVLLLNEPTHGVDIAAKAEIHRQIIGASVEGASVIVASSDVDELVALCHRVVVMWHGRNAGEWMGTDLTVSNITKHLSGIGGSAQA